MKEVFINGCFALLGAFVGSFTSSLFNKKQEKTKYLNEQVQHLYGPVRIKFLEASLCYKRHTEIGNILMEDKQKSGFHPGNSDYDKVYIEYFKIYMNLCRDVKNIFLENFGYIDSDDEKLARTFIQNHIYYDNEYDEANEPKLSQHVRSLLEKKEGAIHSWDASLVKRIEEQKRRN